MAANIKTMADVLAALEASDLPRKASKPLQADVARFCRALGRLPDAVPASSQSLRLATEQLDPRTAGVSRKRWQSLVASVRRALAETGVSPGRQQAVLAVDWQVLLDEQSGCPSRQKWVWVALRRFAAFASAEGIPPQDVSPELLPKFAKHLEDTTLARKPEKAVTATRAAWNQACKMMPHRGLCPFQGGHQRKVTLAMSDLPDNLREDIATYLSQQGLRTCTSVPASNNVQQILRFAAQASRNVMLDARGRRRYLRPLKPATIRTHAEILLGVAASLRAAGTELPSSIARCLTPKNVAEHLAAMEARGRSASSVALAASNLRDIGRRWCPDEVDLDLLASLVKITKDKTPKGVSPKTASRLAVMSSTTAIRELVGLPTALANKARSLAKGGRTSKSRAALAVQAGVALMLLLALPLRRGTLARLELDRNIHIPRHRRDTARISVDGDQNKNGQPQLAELTKEDSRLLASYVETYRPVLCPDQDNRYLFPGLKPGSHKSNIQVTRQVTATIYRELGLTVNMHLFRHFAASLVYEHTGGREEPDKALLGHSQRSNVYTTYTHIRDGWASRKLHEAISTKMSVPVRLRRNAKRAR